MLAFVVRVKHFFFQIIIQPSNERWTRLRVDLSLAAVMAQYAVVAIFNPHVPRRVRERAAAARIFQVISSA